MVDVSDELLNSIANSLGIATKQIYEIYRIGTKKTALLHLICMMVTVFGIIIISNLCVDVVALSNENSDSYWDNNENTRTTIDKFNGDDLIILTCIIVFFSSLWACFTTVVFSSVSEVILPEYHALRQLIYDLN